MQENPDEEPEIETEPSSEEEGEEGAAPLDGEAEEGEAPADEMAEEYTAEPAAEESASAAEAAPASQEGLLQACPNCATLLDVADLEPFAKVHCPICGTAMRARTQLKNFTLIETLGAGGMGAVYRALDTNLDRMVALKVVRKEYSADAEYLAKFEREARITASVNHPHVVKVYSFGSDHGLFYIAMELVDKGSLDDLMSLQGRVAEVQALQVGIQVAQGLNAALQKGLIHRDVKPGNILFADAQTGKIVDFGLALLAEHEAEERGEVWGTPYYVAPEKLDHLPEDFRSDLYSLGGTLFHAIAGRPPFEAETASMVALKHLKSQAVSLQAFAPDVSSATAYVINRMLHKDPDQRYQSYAELIEHLEYAKAQLGGQGGGPRKPKERVVVGGAKEQKVMGLISLVLLLLLVAVGYVGYRFRDRILGGKQEGQAGQEATAADDPQAAAKRLHDRLDAARKQLVSGDYAGAQAALGKLADEVDTQPLQNWITLHQGLASLLQDNVSDAVGWFKVIADHSHFSTDPSDSTLVSFFSDVGSRMSRPNPIAPSAAAHVSRDNVQDLAPFLYGLQDWELGRFDDAVKLLNVYLAASPKEPFQWVGDYKPLAQRCVDNYAAYQKAAAAAAAADTPGKRADALKQAQAIEGQLKGRLAKKLQDIEDGLRKKSAALDATYQQKEQADIQNLDRQFAAECADFKFDNARSAIAAATVSTEGALKEKDALLHKAEWLRQFKTTLTQDINTSGYNEPLVTRTGATLPAGTLRAADSGLSVQSTFGSVAIPWESLPASTIMQIASSFVKKLPPEQAADREWLAGVFACVEGMPRDGRTLLVEASQVKDAYKDQLSLFLESQ